MPKIYINSLKTLDTRASGLHFLTPYWAWSLPWKWYQNVPIIFFHRGNILTKIPKIHAYSFKTLDVRALGLHFPTPSWAWSLPWRRFKKVPIMFFHWANMLTKIPKNSCSQLQNSGCEGLRTAFSNTFFSLRAALRVIPQIQPPHVTPHILMKVVSKFHSPSLSSLGGICGKQPSGIKRYSLK